MVIAGIIGEAGVIAPNALHTSTTLGINLQDTPIDLKGLVNDCKNQFLTTLTIGGVFFILLIYVVVFITAYKLYEKFDSGGVS